MKIPEKTAFFLNYREVADALNCTEQDLMEAMRDDSAPFHYSFQAGDNSTSKRLVLQCANKNSLWPAWQNHIDYGHWARATNFPDSRYKEKIFHVKWDALVSKEKWDKNVEGGHYIKLDDLPKLKSAVEKVKAKRQRWEKEMLEKTTKEIKSLKAEIKVHDQNNKGLKEKLKQLEGRG